MIRHIGSSDSIVHDLTNRHGQLCEHRAGMILYVMHLCAAVFQCCVSSLFMPGFSQLATVRCSKPVIAKWKRNQYFTH